jgi:hypothetical protein
MLLNFMAIWNMLQPFRIFYDHPVYFQVIFGIHIFARFGMLYQEKSGNPVSQHHPTLPLEHNPKSTYPKLI